jgi:glycosyltransferase involved in cell wall biosynthesis
MRKIAFIAANEYVPWGGSELLWSLAAEELARSGSEVRVSVKDWGKAIPQIERLRSAGCQIYYRRPPSFISRQVRKMFPLRDYWSVHIRSVGKGMNLIAISQGNNINDFQWMRAAKSNGYKYAVIAQAASEYSWPSDDWAESLAELYESACAAYFVSKANLALSRRQFVTPLYNGRVVRNPFNVRYDARPAWPGDPSKGLFLACVGRLDTAQKGQDLLIEVLSLSHWRSRDVHVTLVGSGVNERRLRLLVDNRKLSSIDFAGFVNDIEELWSRHHALVLPSRFEGMPLALVEAMLCGRPCIVTDVGGNRELIRDGVNGFLAKAPTVELLDEVMNRAWNSRSHLMDMGNAAATDIRQLVSKDPGGDFVRELLTLVDGDSGR